MDIVLKTSLDTLSDDVDQETDPSVADETTEYDAFLLVEGLEMLSHYRAIRDPQVRVLLRRLVANIVDGQKSRH